jgi:hypothetical protein
MLAEDQGETCSLKTINDGIKGDEMRRVAGAKAVR